MVHIIVEEANAWADRVKLDLGSLDNELEDSVATQVLASVSQAYETSGWSDPNTTPSLIRKIIAMMYTGWYINRVYSEEEKLNDYAMALIGQAERLIEGVVNGSLILVEVPETGAAVGEPEFERTNPVFTMGTIW